ncbi:MAG: hypothetical protein WBL35_15870 [Ornithinibacter sp.]
MYRFTVSHRLLTTTAATLLLVSTASPAMAMPDPGPPLVTTVAATGPDTAQPRCPLPRVGVPQVRCDEHRVQTTTPATTTCPLERVGTQYVRCDNLTGNGVPAPGWVREQ